MSADTGDEEPVVEVEFVVPSATCPFVGFAIAEGCTFELAAMVPRPDGRLAEFFNVTDGDPARVAARTAETDLIEATHLREYESGGLVEFLVTGDCPAFTIAELGGLPREISALDGEGRMVVEIPPQYDPSALIEEFLAEYPQVSLATKREKDTIRPLFTRSTFQQVVQSRLTDRQREVLKTAYESGYYDWPRQCTGEEVAEDLGISSATFSEHIAAAERKLLNVTFEGPE